jgi:glycine dehydrogenase subunit 2
MVVHGAILMEPTETERKKTLDKYIAALKGLTKRAKVGNSSYFPKYQD